jgi:hypothetical protein
MCITRPVFEDVVSSLCEARTVTILPNTGVPGLDAACDVSARLSLCYLVKAFLRASPSSKENCWVSEDALC